MAISVLNITKNWYKGTVVKEGNWDEIEDKMEAWAADTRLNVYQLSRDAYGRNYDFNNSGNPSSYQGKVLVQITNSTIDDAAVGDNIPAAGTFSDIDFNAAKNYYHRPVACKFIKDNIDTQIADWRLDRIGQLSQVRNVDAGFASRVFIADIFLPDDSIVDTFYIYYDRKDAASTLTGALKRCNLSTGAISTMVSVTATNTSGSPVAEWDDTIVNPTIDNDTYYYYIHYTVDTNDETDDAFFLKAQIKYTMTKPLP